MKKLLGLLTLGLVFVLSACGGMSGETTTVCRNAPTHTMSGVTGTVVTIEGYDEDILTWTERITTTVDVYSNTFVGGLELSEDDIRAIFDDFSTPVDGTSWHLVSINGNDLVFDVLYNYEEMPLRILNQRWEGGFDGVTLSAAIRGLEDQGANCQTD